jgi:hypothetical protein
MGGAEDRPREWWKLGQLGPACTDRMLAELVEALTVKQREWLARGPTADPLACRVCMAIEAAAMDAYRAGQRYAPALMLHYWHVMHYEPGGPRSRGADVFERCCRIYRAAGWREMEHSVAV